MSTEEKLMRTIQALKSVRVDGEYWLLMQACVNSISEVIEEIRGSENGINNNT